MSLKITHYTKDKENHNFGKERKSTIANTEINQMPGLSDNLTRIVMEP